MGGVMNLAVVRVKSLGLGNLFFQYATARAIAHRSGGEVALDLAGTIGFQLKAGDNAIGREAAAPVLDLFHLRYRWADHSDIRALRGGPYRDTRWGRRADRLLDRLGLRPVTYYHEPRIYEFDPRVPALHCPVYLEGTLINPRYFSDIGDVLRGELRLVAPLPARLDGVAAQITQGNTIAVHIRRGDYANGLTNNLYPVYGAEYACAAVTEIERRAGKGRCFVFSDDIAWARENILPERDNNIFVSAITANPWEDFELMRRCDHQVIGNSTFSWWAAYLNDNPGKQVATPRRWRNDGYDTSDMILPGWIAL